MYSSEINPAWLEAFQRVFELCKIKPEEAIAVLSESGSRTVNVDLTVDALTRMGLKFRQVVVPTPPPSTGPIIRSTGSCEALGGVPDAVDQLCEADVIIDLTIEGLMHARETGRLLKSGARIMNISNEHPEILCRLVPTVEMKDEVRASVSKCRAASQMTITSDAGTDLTVDMTDAATVGVWGFTDRPGTLAHWPAGLVVSFPRQGSVKGQLVFQPGDINLTFKRYFESTVTFNLEDDFVTSIAGTGADAKLMRAYYEGFHDPLAYATSHVGWGMNPQARYEALTMYDKHDLNGTELRALAGNFLYSTGANEFANRFTHGHFDLPMMGCDIALDGQLVVQAGALV